MQIENLMSKPEPKQPPPEPIPIVSPNGTPGISGDGSHDYGGTPPEINVPDIIIPEPPNEPNNN